MELERGGVVLRISPISIMYFVIAFALRYGLLTAGIVIPGMISHSVVIVLYRTVNTRVRLRKKKKKGVKEKLKRKRKKLKKLGRLRRTSS